jgi:hypothetical protein
VKQIELAKIAVDASTQTRASIDEGVVADYAEKMLNGVQFPAIVLFHDGNQYYIGDGFHRVLATQRNGAVAVASDVRPGTREDALWFALGANREHGHRMTIADKKHAVMIAVMTFPKLTQTEMAQHIGCTQGFVSQVISANNLARPSRVTGSDGKTYPARRRPEREPPPATVSLDRSKDGAIRRDEQMRDMAEAGNTSRQIAAAVGMTEESCRNRLKEKGIAVPADKVAGRTVRHDPNRIVEQMVMDADNLTADANLIAFNALDKEKLGDWIDSLIKAHKALGVFVKRLIKAKENHVEAA